MRSPWAQLTIAAGLFGMALIWVRPGPLLLLGGDGGIYARIARELAERPISTWLELTLDGRGFFEHPPLGLWAEAVAFRLFGASVPVAVGVARAWATLTLCLVGLAAGGRRAPFAMLGLVLLPGFLYTSQVAMFEAPLMASLALSLWALAGAQRAADRLPGWVWVAYLIGTTLGFWAKGPPVLVTWGVVGVLALLRQVKWAHAAKLIATSAAVLTVTILVFESARSVAGLGPFFPRYLVHQVATSFVAGRQHPDPNPFFYVGPALNWYFPALLALLALPLTRLGRWAQALHWPQVALGASLWAGILLGFSAATQKYQWYIHPGAAGVALWVGALLALLPDRFDRVLARLLVVAAVAWGLVRFVPWDDHLTALERQVLAVQSAPPPSGPDRRVADCSEMESWASEHLMGFMWRAARVPCDAPAAWVWDGARLSPR